MAKTVNLHRGGKPALMFPACNSASAFECPMPERVAGEYDRGMFTLGDSLHPAYRPYQAGLLADVANSDLPVTIGLVAVPELHSLTEVFTSTDPTAVANSGYTSTVGCSAHTMAGVTYDVVGVYYDNATCAPTGATEDFGMVGLDASAVVHQHAFTQKFVPAGQTLMLSVVVKTPPTTPGITLAKLAGMISVVAKVGDFQVPNMM